MARKPSLKKQIEALADRFVPDIRAAFLASINGVTSRSMLEQIAEAIRLGDLEKAFRATGMSAAAMRPVAAMIEQAFEAGGVTTTDTLPAVTRPEGATIFRFDVRNSRAEAWLRDQSSGLVTRISDETRTVIQTMMREGMRDGRNPKSVALDIIGRIDPTTGRRTGGVVGLTDRDAKAVANMRRDLAGLNSNYFNREARDRRFDRIVQRAISSEKPLTSEKIEALTARYADNLLQLRGETIARTEGIAALNRAQYEAIAQAIDTGAVNRRNVTKKWDATGDLRTRTTHLAMDGKSVDFDEAFVFPDGSRMMFPGDSSMGAHGSEIINCRCRVDYDIDFLADLTDDDIREGLDLPPAVPPVPVVSPATSSLNSFEEFKANYDNDQPVKAWRSSWNESERDAIEGYINSPQVNNDLRAGRIIQSYKPQIDGLDAAIARAPVFTEPTVLHRTMNRGVLSVGDEYTDGAYVSVSQAAFSQKIWRRYRDEDDIEKLEIIVPVGTPRALIERFPGDEDLNMTEILLPRGSRFRVESQKDDGTLVIRML